MCNVFKPNPDIESDDLPDRWVTGSTADEPQINKLIYLLYNNILAI